MTAKRFPNAWTRPLPASLIRRLGEAADGFRGSTKAYYIISLEPDEDGNHEVLGPYAGIGDVPPEIAKTVKPGKRGWFGPIVTPAAVHTRSANVVITRLVLSTSRASVPLPDLSIPGSTFDSLFYSLSAVEKFAIPYYARMFGGAYVKRLRDSFLADEFQLLGHLPGTEYQNPGSPGIAAVVRYNAEDVNGEVQIEPILPGDGSGNGQRDGRRRKSGSRAR